MEFKNKWLKNVLLNLFIFILILFVILTISDLIAGEGFQSNLTYILITTIVIFISDIILVPTSIIISEDYLEIKYILKATKIEKILILDINYARRFTTLELANKKFHLPKFSLDNEQKNKLKELIKNNLIEQIETIS